jgi:hypothetical protein
MRAGPNGGTPLRPQVIVKMLFCYLCDLNMLDGTVPLKMIFMPFWWGGRWAGATCMPARLPREAAAAAAARVLHHLQARGPAHCCSSLDCAAPGRPSCRPPPLGSPAG